MQLVHGFKSRMRFRWAVGALALLYAAMPLTPASAELVISQLVVELDANARTADVEILNDSEERSFVAIEPREIIEPGTTEEKAFSSPDPDQLGLLVSPRRLILEPGQRRTVRIARIEAGSSDRERVYRLTVKPVVGEVSGAQSGLKLLVGYDLLLLARPAVERRDIRVSRRSDALVFTNHGNSSAELVDGVLCASKGAACQELPNKRLYAGASWEQSLTGAGTGEYRVRTADGWSKLDF